MFIVSPAFGGRSTVNEEQKSTANEEKVAK